MGMHHNSNLLDYRFWPFFWHEPSIFVGPNDLTHTPSIPPGESETSELSQTVAEFAAKLLGTAGLRSFSAWKKWGAGGDGRLRWGVQQLAWNWFITTKEREREV
jgi:hypothetical protein